jgi:membrane associated rhomboid family serine protease
MKLNLTLSLVAANVLLFLVQLALPAVTDALSLTPAVALGGAWWQFVTYMFMHGGVIHIAFNMFVLFTFGLPVEGMLGTKRFAVLYFISGIGSALVYMGVISVLMPAELNVMMLGASGAIFAVLTAYGFLFPKNMVWIPPGIPMPAWLAVVAFAALELFLGLTGLEPGVANFGHLGGIIFGLIIMLAFRFSRKGISYGNKNLRDYEFVWE